jgi:hypothetical protein
MVDNDVDTQHLGVEEEVAKGTTAELNRCGSFRYGASTHSGEGYDARSSFRRPAGHRVVAKTSIPVLADGPKVIAAQRQGLCVVPGLFETSLSRYMWSALTQVRCLSRRTKNWQTIWLNTVMFVMYGLRTLSFFTIEPDPNDVH